MLSINVLTAQEQSDNTQKKIVETTFTVEGVCGMCKERIENAALRTSGVKMAEWTEATKELKVVYKTKKLTEEEIHKAIAAAGHETSMISADSAAYKKLPGCCLYKDDAECGHHDSESPGH